MTVERVKVVDRLLDRTDNVAPKKDTNTSLITASLLLPLTILLFTTNEKYKGMFRKKPVPFVGVTKNFVGSSFYRQRWHEKYRTVQNGAITQHAMILWPTSLAQCRKSR